MVVLAAMVFAGCNSNHSEEASVEIVIAGDIRPTEIEAAGQGPVALRLAFPNGTVYENPGGTYHVFLSENGEVIRLAALGPDSVHVEYKPRTTECEMGVTLSDGSQRTGRVLVSSSLGPTRPFIGIESEPACGSTFSLNATFR